MASIAGDHFSGFDRAESVSPPADLQSKYACKVDDCQSTLKTAYDKKCRTCAAHRAVDLVLFSGTMQRFCHKCGRFHTEDMFDGGKKNCRQSLMEHNMRQKRLRMLRKMRKSSVTTELEAEQPSISAEDVTTTSATEVGPLPELPQEALVELLESRVREVIDQVLLRGMPTPSPPPPPPPPSMMMPTWTLPMPQQQRESRPLEIDEFLASEQLNDTTYSLGQDGPENHKQLDTASSVEALKDAVQWLDTSVFHTDDHLNFL